MRCGTPLIAALFFMLPGGAFADSSSPLLAAYYDRQMAIVEGGTYAWQGRARPQRIDVDASQVGVGRDVYYALNKKGHLLAWRHLTVRPTPLMRGVTDFAAGSSAVLAITKDGVLWRIDPLSKARKKIAGNVAQAAVGDGANYYITKTGALFVRVKSHRGQYGNGRLTATKDFIQTASAVVRVSAHTGHAILLTKDGNVLGTGGNIYGPVGRHGLGDKAVRWSPLMANAKAVATGSLHTLAIRQDNGLFAWGDGYGTEPKLVMSDVVAVAAGSSRTIALRRDGTLWQWERGANPERLRLR